MFLARGNKARGFWSRRTFRAEELPRDVEGFAAHHNDLLTIEQLLSDRAGQATEQMALAVDDLVYC